MNAQQQSRWIVSDIENCCSCKVAAPDAEQAIATARRKYPDYFKDDSQIRTEQLEGVEL